MKILFTPREYVLNCIAKNPATYIHPTYDGVALLVFERFFELGGRHEASERLIEEITAESGFNETSGLRYITDEPLYVGTYNSPPFSPHREPVVCLKEDQKNYPDVAWWSLEQLKPAFTACLSFHENRSTVYIPNFKNLDNEWQDAAIWFYKQCKKFMQETPEKYNGALITEYQINYLIIQIKGKVVSLKKLIKMYNQPFDGNYEKFIATMWQKEFDRIMKFIDDTIIKLEANKT